MDRQGGGSLDEVRSVIASTVGGIMTEEAGAVTGDVEVAIREEPEGLRVLVRYDGADEWYTVEGSPIRLRSVGLRSTSQLRELHERMLERLKTPGKTLGGNEEPTSLLGFPSTVGHG